MCIIVSGRSIVPQWTNQNLNALNFLEQQQTKLSIFYEQLGYSASLEELKGIDLVMNMCKPCYTLTMNKIKTGKHFKSFFIYVFR